MSQRKIRVLTIIDDCSRDVLAAHADFSLPAQRVVDVLELIALNRPYPEQIRVDNGPRGGRQNFWLTNSSNGARAKASRSITFSQEIRCKMVTLKD